MKNQTAYAYEVYSNEEERRDIINGKFFDMSPAPSNKHQWIVQKIAFMFEQELEDCELCQVYISPFDWRISDNTVVQPDVAIFCNKEEFFADYFTKAPVLIVEVLSKSTALKDKNIKYKLYEKQGVKYYIIVEPDYGIADIFELKQDKYEKVKTLAQKDKFDFYIHNCKLPAQFNRIFKLPAR